MLIKATDTVVRKLEHLLVDGAAEDLQGVGIVDGSVVVIDTCRRDLWDEGTPVVIFTDGGVAYCVRWDSSWAEMPSHRVVGIWTNSGTKALEGEDLNAGRTFYCNVTRSVGTGGDEDLQAGDKVMLVGLPRKKWPVGLLIAYKEDDGLTVARWSEEIEGRDTWAILGGVRVGHDTDKASRPTLHILSGSDLGGLSRCTGKRILEMSGEQDEAGEVEELVGLKAL